MPAAVLIPALASAVGGGVAAGASIYGSKKSSSTALAAAKYQQQQANYGADLEAKAAAEALAFAKEQEAARHGEFTSTQDRNYQMWQADQAKGDARYATHEANLDPYRQWGVGAIGQLMRPMGAPPPGSIGSLMGGS